MNLVLHSARYPVAVATLLALVLAGIVLAAPVHAAAPQAVELESACEGTESAGFTDTEGTTFEFEIDCFAGRGFTQGTGDGTTYEPVKANRRWQMATFIYRVLQSVDDANQAFDLPAPEDQGFTDISTLDEEFQNAINVLAALDVVRGTTATQFDPFSGVRRDQMASFVNRGQGAIQDANDGDPDGFATNETFFPDVNNNVHEANINGIASVGIVQGRADGRYHAADPVNRGQMAAFVMRWVQVLEDGGFYEDELDNGNLDGVDVVDTNASGVLDVGDLVGLRFDGSLDELVGDGADDAINLADGDGTVLTLNCGNDRCLQDDTGLDGSPILGDDGLLVVGVADDNLVELGSGAVDGLDVDGEVTDVSEGVVSEDGDPLEVAEGGVPLDVLDLDGLDQASLDGLVDLIDSLLGDLLSEDMLGGNGILDVEDLLGGGLFG
jgi:hypothetical protein